MKKLYSFWLTALFLLFASFQAGAALTLNLKWNTPDAIDVYVGSTNVKDLKTLPAGATQYTAVIDKDWGSTYIGAKSGYNIVSVVADGTTLKPMYNGMYNINMDTYNGKTVEIEIEAIQYDGTFSINVINGRDALYVEMWGTKRVVEVKTGLQSIPYSTKFETGVHIQAPVNGSENPVLKQGGIEMEWQKYYDWDTDLYHKYNGTSTKGFSFADGTDFYVKYCETPDEAPSVSATVNVNYSGFGAQAISMFFNITQKKTINNYETFTTNIGDEVRFVFNTTDYVITINGTELSPAIGEATTAYEFTVNGDMNINVSATEREYGNTYVTFAASDINGLVLRAGYFDGEIIDHSKVTRLGTTSYSYKDFNQTTQRATLNLYQAEVSLKSPKVFIDAAPEYWIAASEYNDGSDVVEAGVASPNYTLYVVNFPIVRDTKVVVYLATDGYNVKPSDLMFRDRQRNEFTLVNGYNEFMIDKAYSSPLSVNGMDIAEGTAFSVYCDMTGISRDEETGGFSCDITGDASIHIFAGRPASPEHTITAYFAPDAKDAEVVLDRVHKLTPDSPTFSTFRGCEIAVTPGANVYLLDSEAPEFDGASHSFTASADHSIIFGDVAKMNITPAEGAEIEEFTNFVITFPNATDVTVNEEATSDIMLRNNKWTYGASQFEITQVNGAKVPTFRVVPQPELPTVSGEYTLILPEGLFTVQGVVASAETTSTFTLQGSVNIEDIPVVFEPESKLFDKEFTGVMILFGEDFGDYEIEATEAAGEIAVSFDGNEWVMGEDYSIEVEQNVIFIAHKAEVSLNHVAQLTVNIPAGAFLVSGAESLAIDHTWTVLPAAADVNVDGEIDSSDLAALINVITGLDEADCDINGDGEVDSSDLAALITIIVGD